MLSLSSYRYGFNGMEKDDNIKGEGNSYTTEFRQYDPRVGRWLSVDPMERNFPSESPYNFSYNSPLIFTDQGGDSPISVLAKWIAKKGAKIALEKYSKRRIERRLKRYMTEDMRGQLVKDLDNVLSTLDQSWWETAIEFIPVAGDIYGAGTFGVKIAKAWDKLQKIENRYVDKVYKSLPEKQKKKFKSAMRNAGVRDARKDQRNGVRNGDKYTGDGSVDGHHKKSVKENPDKMSDPSNIHMLKKDKHRRLHKGEFEIPEKPVTNEEIQKIEEVTIKFEKTHKWEKK